jgi:hypothetical protein
MRSTLTLLPLGILACLCLALLHAARKRDSAAQQRENLVLYVFAATDPQFRSNLEFFVREAVQGDTISEYVFIIQESSKLKVRGRAVSCRLARSAAALTLEHLTQAKDLPILPKHARYVRHSNRCYDWGTLGWFLHSGIVDPSRYK